MGSVGPQIRYAGDSGLKYAQTRRHRTAGHCGRWWCGVLFSQPKRATIEYHKRAYLAASNRLQDRPTRLKYWYFKATKRQWRPVTFREIGHLVQEMQTHRAALVALGYLGERRFTVTNQYPGVIGYQISGSKLVDKDHLAMTGVYWQTTETGPTTLCGTNVIVIKGVLTDMPIWEQLIRKADVPW
jgi:hypothetical protein